MTQTSAEQPEALMKLAEYYAEACFDQGLHQRTTDDKPEAAREKLEKELLRLHARMQDLEAERAAIIAEKDEYKVALRAARTELEASQAQRVQLSDEAMWKILDKTHNLPEFDSYELDALFQAGRNVEAACIGITQEKQG